MNVCQGCGSQKDVMPCTHCLQPICGQCCRPHESICEMVQKRKARGQGPTVRHTSFNPILGMPYSLTALPVTPEEGYASLLQEREDGAAQVNLNGSFHDAPATSSEEPVNQDAEIDIGGEA
jgi:hypothetical protein